MKKNTDIKKVIGLIGVIGLFLAITVMAVLFKLSAIQAEAEKEEAERQAMYERWRRDKQVSQIVRDSIKREIYYTIRLATGYRW